MLFYTKNPLQAKDEVVLRCLPPLEPSIIPSMKIILMAVLALIVSASMVAILIWTLRRLKKIEHDLWGEKT